MTTTPTTSVPTSTRPVWVAAILVVLVSATAVVANVGFATKSPTLVLVATLALWLLAVLWSVLLAPGGYVFCAFLVSFFVFLLARPAIVLLFGADPQALTGLFGTNFWSQPLITDMFMLLYVSLSGLVLGGLIVSGLRARTRAPVAAAAWTEVGEFTKAVRTWSLVLFFVALPFQVIILLERGAAASGGNFYELRVASASSLPSIVHLIAGMVNVFFFAFLATRPRKDQAVVPILAFFTLGVISLSTWQRSDFVLSAMFIILYLIHRHQTDTSGERWISRRMVVSGAALLLPVVAALQFLGEIRGRSSASTSYPLFGLVDFLYGQGVTVNVIGYAISMEERVPEGKYYSFGPAIEFVRWNLGRVFTGADYPTGQTLERAADGHQFAHLISYLVMPDMYLQGSGYGSSFVAELWIDAGLAGLVLGSMALGVGLMVLPRILLSRNIVVTALALMVMCEIMFTPRANFIGYLVTPLGVSSLGGAALLAFIVFLTTRRDHERIQRRLSSLESARRVHSQR